jgi:hypothetical protein
MLSLSPWALHCPQPPLDVTVVGLDPVIVVDHLKT